MESKISKYTSIIPLANNYWIIYNSFTDKFVVAKNDCKLTEQNILFKQEVRASLIEAGIILQNSENELNQLADRISKILDCESRFQLHINPTLACNFRCWYCYERHDNMRLMNNEILSSVLKFIKHKIDMLPLREFSLSFFGGEPLLGYQKVVRPIIDYCCELCTEKNISFSVHFTTNGYLIDEGMITYFKQFNTSFQITLDGHRDFHNKTRYNTNKEGSYDRILSNVCKLAESKCHIIIRINYTKDNILSVFGIAEDLKALPQNIKNFMRIDLQRVWQDKEKMEIFSSVLHAILFLKTAWGICLRMVK